MAFFSVVLDENLKQAKTLIFSTLSNLLFSYKLTVRCKMILDIATAFTTTNT
jgi:hypothetical protein